MRFEDPVALLVIPLALAVFLLARRRARAALRYPSLRSLGSRRPTPRVLVRRLIPWMEAAALVLLGLALARPQQGDERTRITTEGIAIEMAIDASGSMRALDFQTGEGRRNRLDVVKEVLRDFIDGKGGLPGRPNDLLGLIAFGGFADSKCPLTLDHGALIEMLDAVQIPEEIRDHTGRVVNAEEFQTAVGDALALAVERLKGVDSKSKVVILLTDGESNFGALTPDQAAEIARAFGVKVYTIGVGTTGIVPVPGVDMFGRPALQRMRVRMDEKTLESIAEVTGGRFFQATDPASLRRIYEEIDELEKTEMEVERFVDYQDRFALLVAPALALLLLGLFLENTWLLSIP